MHAKCRYYDRIAKVIIVTAAKKEIWALAGKCLTDRVVHQATVTREDNSKVENIGLKKGTIKS